MENRFSKRVREKYWGIKLRMGISSDPAEVR